MPWLLAQYVSVGWAEELEFEPLLPQAARGTAASMAAQASIVFLDKVREGETLIAEATEVAREGRAGVTRVAVSAGDGRKVAEFTGYSRTLGGSVVEI